MKRRSATYAWIISIALIIAIAGCSSQNNVPNTQENTTNPIVTTAPVKTDTVLKGISLSPKSYGAGDFIEFFNKAKQSGSIVTWVGDWQQLGNETAAPHVVAQLSAQYNYKPMIIAQFFHQSNGDLLRQLTNETKKSYSDIAVNFVKKYRPEYIGFGVEINMLHEKSPATYEQYVEFYNTLYDNIKAESPNTKVFTVFQLERLRGLKGGLFGGVNNQSANEWTLLDGVKTDIAVFTTYPGLIYKDPNEIPADYYDEIQMHTSKPVAFSETGWFRNGPREWDSSSSEQADFINALFNRTKNTKPVFIIWSFLYDQNAQPPADTMGLLTRDASSTVAWETWIKAK